MEFAQRTMSSPLHPWQLVLSTILERLRHEQGLRIVLHAPPQVGKSILVSQRLPAYLIGELPTTRVGLACYNETHATNFGSVIRDICASSEYAQMYPGCVVDSYDSAKEFSTDPRKSVRDGQPSFKAMGLLSGFVGRGVDHLIIDDPYKSAADAESAAINGAVKRWWSATARPRIGDRTNVLVMFHRYHNEDFAAELFAEGNWEYFRFPGVADAEEGHGSDPTLGVTRELGEALSPLKSLSEYQREEAADAATYSSQVKGIPLTASGTMFKIGQIKLLSERPLDIVRSCRAWDIAATEGGGDYTAGVLIGITKSGRFVILDVVLLQGSPDQVDTAIQETAVQDGRKVEIHLAEDPGSAGKRDARAIGRRLAGFIVTITKVSGSKILRARGFASQVNLGNVDMVESTNLVSTGPHAGKTVHQAMLSMMKNFPLGTAKKDGVDAGADAFQQLTGRRVIGGS